MNIFYTNTDPKKCALEHCTVHTRKMITEYAQLLSTTHRVLDGDEFADDNGLYKSTHINHPCTKWVQKSAFRYEWLYDTYVELCNIYNFKTSKMHKSPKLIDVLYKIPDNISFDDFVEPPLAMPDDIKLKSFIDSYKNFILTKYNDWVNRERKIKVEWYIEQPKWVNLWKVKLC